MSWGKRESPGHPCVIDLGKEKKGTIKRKEEMKRASTINYLELVSWDFLKLSQLLSELFPNKAASYKTQSSVDKSIIDNNVKHMIQKCPAIRNGLNKNSLSIYGTLGRHLKGCLEGYEITWKSICNPMQKN